MTARTAAAILAIPESQPELLFRKTMLREDHRDLVKAWHPDLNKDPQAGAVVAHVNRLFDLARQKVAGGKWSTLNHIEWTNCSDGKRRSFLFKAKRPFELGTMYIGASFIAIEIDKRYEDLMLRGLRVMNCINYPSAAMRKNLYPAMPHVAHSFETADSWVQVLEVGGGRNILLADLMKRAPLDPRHVAWIVSDLFNLAAFFEVNKLTHNAITADTVFVSPAEHAVGIYGGWWYAAKTGDDIHQLPPKTYRLTPRRMLASKKAAQTLDIECIKAIGSDLLAGSGPDPFQQFLRSPTSGSGINEYGRWEQAREKSFGERRFVELETRQSDIYPTGDQNGK